MKHAVREDPDVMLVGEMRDPNIMTAIHAAETGHLCSARFTPRLRPHRLSSTCSADHARALRSAIGNEGMSLRSSQSIKRVGRVPTCEIRFQHHVQNDSRRNDESCPLSAWQARRMQDFTMSSSSLWTTTDRREVAMEVAPNREALKWRLKARG